MDIVWKPSFSASCLHIADALRQGREVDPRWDVVRPAVAELKSIGEEVNFGFWELARGLAGEHPSHRELAERIVAKLGGIHGQLVPLEGALGALKTAVLQVEPRLESELDSRLRPLREQWDARGPGFLRALEGPLDGLLAGRAVVYLVHPLLGGGGAAHLWFNSVSIEGVLHHTTEVPEMVRLGWLLSQLQFDIPAVSENFNASELGGLARWAVLPAVHQAARDVQWLGEQTLANVLACWRLSKAENAAGDARVLEEWWRGCAGRRWPQRLAALRETFLDV